MKSFLLKIISPLSKVIPVGVLSSLTGQHVINPVYHCISNEQVPHIKHLYQVKNVKEFEKDLDFFLKNYNPLDPLIFLKKVNAGEKISHNSFLLSFDDGLKEFNDVVAPILKRKGVPAICFLNSDFVDNNALFYRYKASLLCEEILNKEASEAKIKLIREKLQTDSLDRSSLITAILKIKYNNKEVLDEIAKDLDVDFEGYLHHQQPYLNKAQIQKLVKEGFCFGAHSCDHPMYSQLSLEEQLQQTRESISKVTQDFNLDYKLFSFPFTDDGINNKFFSKVYREDNPIADLTFGTAGLKKDQVKRNIQRIGCEVGYSAREIIYMEYIYFILKSVINKNKIIRS